MLPQPPSHVTNPVIPSTNIAPRKTIKLSTVNYGAKTYVRNEILFNNKTAKFKLSLFSNCES